VERVNLVAKNCYGLGNVLEEQGRSDEARRIYDRTVEVAQYLLQRGQISPRDVRTTLDLAFIAYQGPAALETRERIRLLLQGPR
jgi:hypothetical protein